MVARNDVVAVPLNDEIGLPWRELRLAPTTGTTAAWLALHLFPEAEVTLVGLSYVDDPAQTSWEHQFGDEVGVGPEHRIAEEGRMIRRWLDAGPRTTGEMREMVGRIRIACADGCARCHERLDRQHGRIAELERELDPAQPAGGGPAGAAGAAAAAGRRSDVPATDEEQAEARSLVEAVRAEHARVRARISAATVFEERLRVLEERSAAQAA